MLSSFSQVTTYPATGFYPVYTLTQTANGLGTVGTIYRVKFRALNIDNQYSSFSNELIFALGPLPSTPNAPMKDSALSN